MNKTDDGKTLDAVETASLALIAAIYRQSEADSGAAMARFIELNKVLERISVAAIQLRKKPSAARFGLHTRAADQSRRRFEPSCLRLMKLMIHVFYVEEDPREPE